MGSKNKSSARSERGTVLIEFVFAIIIFAAFAYGLLAISLWGIGAFFIQEAAHEAAERYAVTMDESSAESRALGRLGKWAYAFVKPESVSASVWKDGDSARARVVAEPRIKRLYLYELPQIEKTSLCVFEYRFRRSGEFLW